MEEDVRVVGAVSFVVAVVADDDEGAARCGDLHQVLPRRGHLLRGQVEVRGDDEVEGLLRAPLGDVGLHGGQRGDVGDCGGLAAIGGHLHLRGLPGLGPRGVILGDRGLGDGVGHVGGGLGGLAGVAQRDLGEVDGGDVPAAAEQPCGVAALAAADIGGRAGRQLGGVALQESVRARTEVLRVIGESLVPSMVVHGRDHTQRGIDPGLPGCQSSRAYSTRVLSPVRMSAGSASGVGSVR